MAEFATFGAREKFAVRVRWAEDSEPLSRRPARYGWSMGDLEIVVADRTITRSRRGRGEQGHVGWYLLPIFDWLATNWAAIFHEEDFAWREKSSAPAVVACHRALDLWIGESDPIGKEGYRKAQAWYGRHALRACAEGGLLPDLFIRRFLDDIEVSWSASAPKFAPDGFAFVAEPGTARLPVDDVAGPLWEMLNWAVSCPPTEPAGSTALRELGDKIAAVEAMPASDFAGWYADPEIMQRVVDVLCQEGDGAALSDEVAAGERANVPAIRTFSPAVAMFGGVSPDLRQNDVAQLTRLLASQMGKSDEVRLAELVAERHAAPLGVPHEDGYAFAADLLDDLGLPGSGDFVDIRAVVEGLGIEIRELSLVTTEIRGVALAGADIGPTIAINAASIYNAGEEGRRFTLAHELCHILFDRNRARRVSHISGPWVAPGIEKRANAFAAYFLMPRALVLRVLSSIPVSGPIDRDLVTTAARRMSVNESALIEHLYNIDVIGDADRERLRAAFRH
jgi:Zn-dependent peptidase ImmA (M78 family)